PRPLLEIRLADIPELCVAKLWPAFIQRDQRLVPIIAGPLFNLHVAIQVFEMRLCRIAESHFRGADSRAAAPCGAILFEEFRELCFGYTEMRCAERLPNFLAAYESPRIVTA